MRLLAELIAPGSTVLVVGGDGLVDEVEKAGFVVTRSAEDRPPLWCRASRPRSAGPSSRRPRSR